jgi:hypothetical protein
MPKTTRKGYVVVYPNREKASSVLVKFIVAGLLVVSAILIAALTVGGWSKLEGLKALDIAWFLIYLVLAFWVAAKWSRGALTFASALGIILLFLALIAGGGVAGTSWFQRDSFGFAAPQSLFGGGGFGPSTLGVITVLLAPVQAALIVFALIGFRQAWNIETEIPEEEARNRGRGKGDGRRSSPSPATA